ncbi:hypothetical protein [Butyrivibrio sp. AD3002]|uniref:hypothetical protein n=1 Tax=Butyrivibrio sp. AD3002 TaxID=1280670 RepID=UPI0003B5AB81|nr:hypothetical protein [Butyrivibrio sp. AD3002]
MEEAKIQICIPTRNNIQDIDITLQSVWGQDYPQDNVYITVMDFGSKDGTYEKLLSYDQPRFGLYRGSNTANRRQMLNSLQSTIERCDLSGVHVFTVVLYPGDILYPNYLRRCVTAMIKNAQLNPIMCICETDIIESGTKRKQKPLYDTDCIIDGNVDVSDYIKRGFRHQIQIMGNPLGKDLYRSNGMTNERRWWNKCAYTNNERYACYIREPLAGLKPVIYEDELEEILLRWESIIIQVRTYETQYGRAFDKDFSELGFRNLADYAVWRSFILLDKDRKASEDCYLVAKVIAPRITDTALWEKISLVQYKNDVEAKEYLTDYYDRNGWN